MQKTFKDKKKANAFIKKMKEKGHFAIPMWSEKDQTTTVLHGSGEPGPSEGTGIPPGQEGTAPPSIFEQKKKKKLGRSPGAMGGKIKKVNKAGGGMTGVGLYPAEMARAGTMSQAKRKRYMKKGGGISYKMSGGQVVSHGYD